MSICFRIARLLIAAALVIPVQLAFAAPPAVLSHQGRIAVDGVNFDGTGYFKFALIQDAGLGGEATVWETGVTSVPVTIAKGHYSVLLGQAPTPPLSPGVFADNDNLVLRIEFSSDGTSFETLSPDRPVTTTPYAFVATTVPDGSITAEKLSLGGGAGQVLSSTGNGLAWIDPMSGPQENPVIFWAGGPASSFTLNDNLNWVKVPLGVTETNTAASHLTANANGEVTINIAGFYEVTWDLLIRGYGQQFGIEKNGVLIRSGYSAIQNNVYHQQSLTTLQWFEVDDVIECVAKSGNATIAPAYVAGADTRLQIRYIGNTPAPAP